MKVETTIAEVSEADQPEVADEAATADAGAHRDTDRHSIAVSDAMAIQLQVAEIDSADQCVPSDLPVSPTHVVRLRVDGLQLMHEQKLKHSQRVWLIFRLGPDQKQVVSAAIVDSCESKKDNKGAKRFDTVLRFINTTTEFQGNVQAHIDYVLSKTCRYKREYTYTPPADGMNHHTALNTALNT